LGARRTHSLSDCEAIMKIGVLRGRENSFPDAFIAKVNSMDKGVTAEYIHLGGTKLNEGIGGLAGTRRSKIHRQALSTPGALDQQYGLGERIADHPTET